MRKVEKDITGWLCNVEKTCPQEIEKYCHHHCHHHHRYHHPRHHHRHLYHYHRYRRHHHHLQEPFKAKSIIMSLATLLFFRGVLVIIPVELEYYPLFLDGLPIFSYKAHFFSKIFSNFSYLQISYKCKSLYSTFK